MRGCEKDLSLALVISVGVHLIAMLTLDVPRAGWRHGFQPSLQLRLEGVPSVAAADTASRLEPESRQAPPVPGASRSTPRAGVAARSAAAVAALPLVDRYYRNAEVDVPAVSISRVPLVIPEHAHYSRLVGKVRARVFIGTDGTVDAVHVLDAHPVRGLFEETALQALQRTRYRPAEIAGRPVMSQKVVEVLFDPRADDPKYGQ